MIIIIRKKRKGLALIEFVVALVIIAVLSGVLVFSSLEGIASARASRAIESMRIIKTAVLAWINNNPDHIYKDGKVNKDMTKVDNVDSDEVQIQRALVNENNRKLILKYIENGKNLDFNTDNDGNYYCKEDEYEIVSGGTIWFVGYRFSKLNSGIASMNRRVREKVAGRANTEGLLKSHESGSKPYTAGTGADDAVYMKIIEF